MKNRAVLFFCAAVMIIAGLTGCSKAADSQISTPAEHEAIKGRQATPEEMQAAMAKAAQSQAKAQQQSSQQPK